MYRRSDFTKNAYRVREAMEEATDREDFLKRLTAHGVEGEYRSSKKQGDYIIYELTDLSGFEGELPKKKEYFKSKSYKMGTDFGIEELDKQIQNNLGKDAVQVSPVKEDTEPVMKHHTAKKEEPKQKTEEELKAEKDKQLKTRFNYLAGIDFFKDHTTWETKDNFDELMQESDRRWKQFKEWYPDDYEQRLSVGDISEPKQKEPEAVKSEPVQAVIEPVKVEIPAEEPVKSHTEPVPTVKKPLPRSKTKEELEKERIQEQIDSLVQYGERIQTDAEKQAMQELNDWYNKKY